MDGRGRGGEGVGVGGPSLIRFIPSLTRVESSKLSLGVAKELEKYENIIR